MNRRTFIRRSLAAGVVSVAAGNIGMAGSLLNREDLVRLTILHTNDQHSRIDPFPNDGGRNAGLGGAAKRATLVKKIRNEEKNVLLLDAGDILQGTPYFNMFKGDVEFNLMDEMAYDAATIGNHDFDAGIDQLATLLKGHNLSMVNANYKFTDTPLEGLVEPFQIFEMDDLKVGVFGVGIKLKGLVPKEWYGNVQYQVPIEIASNTAKILKRTKKCDYVICLSHLGYSYRNSKLSDIHLAQETSNIDLIIGGHTHTFLDMPDVRRNTDGEAVVITQAGWAGIKLGRLDVEIGRKSKKKQTASNPMWIRELGRK